MDQREPFVEDSVVNTDVEDQIAATSHDANVASNVEISAISEPVVDLCVAPSTSSNATSKKAYSDVTQPEEGTNGAGECEASTSASTSSTLECPICLQTCIHPARLACGHIFCFLCVKGVAYKNRRCAMCRREIAPEFIDHPQLVNGIDDICTTKATEDGYQWFYEGRNGWWQYDDRTSQDVEEAYKKGEKSCTILVAGYVYTVDLETMVQQRQNEPSRCRRVKRDLATVPKKGVAGLRIEGNTVITDSNFAAQVYRNAPAQGTFAHADSPTGLGMSLAAGVRLTANAREFISNLTATDAALRIASDIIGSTLAHADELPQHTTAAAAADTQHSSGEHHTNTSGNTIPIDQYAATPTVAEFLGRGLAADALIDVTRSAATETFPQQPVDLLQQTLNNLQSLTLRDNDESSDEEDARGVHYSRRQIQF